MSGLNTPPIRAAGLAMVAVGLAHRMAFFSWVGLALTLSGFIVVGLGGLSPADEDRSSSWYPILFVLFCVVAALAPFDPSGPNPVEAAVTIGAGVAFYALGARPAGRPFRLYVAGLLLVAAHAHYLLRFGHPLHQDVWTFLNGGADALIRGQNPYRGVSFVEQGLRKVVPFTYPPGALVELAPFRWLLGDVRWAYVLAEAAVIALWGWTLRRQATGAGWREALVLIPLALPRTSQAFYIFTNHEWELLALALGALVLAWERRVAAAGIVIGLGIASKQYFLVFPALFLLPALRPRALVIGLAVALAITVPFLAWSPGDLLHDLFANLSQGVASDRLTLWAALDHIGVQPARSVQLIVLGMVLAGALVAAYRVRGDLRLELVLCGLSLAAFAFVSAFAAYNYYVYALTFVTWGMLLPPALAATPLPSPSASGHG